MNEKFFSEYRPQDYRTARSMRELCGWDAPIYVMEEEGGIWRGIFWAFMVGAMILLVALPLLRKFWL